MSSDLEKIITLIQSRDAANLSIAVEILKANPELQHQAQCYYDGLINMVGIGHILDIELALERLQVYISDHNEPMFNKLIIRRHYNDELWRTVKALTSPAFQELKELILVGVEVNNDLLHAIGQLDKLAVLEINNCDLTHFPSEILRLKNLGLLALNKNKIPSIPKEIAMLQHLYHLDLSYNQIKQLPDDIGALHQLHLLDLSSNQLTDIPLTINKLQGIGHINFCNNNISEIPNALYQLSQLVYLDLSLNSISTISDEISKIPLIMLYLYRNKIPQSRIQELRNLMPNCVELD